MKQLDKYEILQDKSIQVREVEILTLQDRSTINGGYSRYVVTPDMTITLDNMKYQEIADIASLLWTQEVISAYNTIINQGV